MFATIVELEDFKSRHLRLYTVVLEDESASLFEDFVERHSTLDELNIILAQLTTLGNMGGVPTNFLRGEDAAEALPAKALQFVEGEYVSCALRLYCIRVSAHALILLNGAVKTAQKVQNCPNAYPYFKQANGIATAYDASFRMKYGGIRLDSEGRYLDSESDFELDIR